ncbi:MAG: dihydroneopterin aldolase [Nitrospiraceae bacterium]
MAERLIIERLEFQGHCGVTTAERQTLQPIAIDLELDYAPATFALAASTGDIAHAVDYAAVAARVLEVGRKQPYVLLETLGEELLAMLFAEFPIAAAKLWVRKAVPPVADVFGSVGVRLERTRPVAATDPRPAQFLKDHVHLLPAGRVLDVACGRGRNALFLAAQGYTVDAVDRDEQALAEAAATAVQRGLASVTVRAVELEDPAHPPDIPSACYDAVLVLFYLYRPLFPALLRALKPGGVLLYETFLIDNHLRHRHPRRQEFCLAHNELLHLATGLRVLHYDEGEHADAHGGGSAFTARLLARKNG